MNYEKIFSAIDSLADKYISVWEDICNIESPTSFKEGVDRVCEYITELSEALGFEVEFLRQPISGDAACIVMNSSANAPAICLSGHMDTVHAVGSFGAPAVRRDGEKIYGPGVCDCKGGIVAALLAMEALKNCGFEKRPIKLILQSDEEVGSKTSNLETVRFMCEKANGAEAFLNLEGYTRGAACITRKGIATFKFTVHGIEAHSSHCADRGANAIIDAAHKMIELDKIRDKDGLTCNCAVISGGTVVNTVPGECSFMVNVRYSTKEQYEWISEFAAKLSKTVHVAGCTCDLELMGSRIAMELTERNTALLARMNAIFEDVGLHVLHGKKRNGGSDAAYVTDAKIPCVDSLGVEGDEIHSVREFAYIASLAESAKRIAAVAVNI